MSGMKFRLQCASCNTVFFAPDRRARYCPKCFKKRTGKPSPEQGRSPSSSAAPAARVAHKPSRGTSFAAKARKEPEKKAPKANELTPELRERLEQIYREQYASSEIPLREMVQQISDKLWLKRKIVGAIIHRIRQPEIEISPELSARVIETYQGYVDRGERPPGGRRITISQMLDIPYHQVKKIVYQWSQIQYGQSPTPELSREQKFAIEKLYWDELRRKRYRLNEIPAKIAEHLGYATPYQVSRWLDMLHDDDRKFERVNDLSPEIERRIYEAYLQYLEIPNPPEHGLHTTIAQEIGDISSRQVHKALQRFRKQMRAEYPLQ